MDSSQFTIEQLWQDIGFKPNGQQRDAILHVDGPLYLPAGPGSGKTRVLLWRTLNLIVFHEIHPDEIYLSTFTEKAALQLKEGLRALLASVTARTGKPYDLANMYVGTVHSLCQRLLIDRRFYPNRQRGRAPLLLDELGQYFYIYKRRMWANLTGAVDLGSDPQAAINLFLAGQASSSRHVAVANTLAFFNRLSEERIDPTQIATQTSDPTLQALLEMYRLYVASLRSNGVPVTDFALLQQAALQVLDGYAGSGRVFKHVIIDEYQDTNSIQEQLFFRLARGHQNICVVGDDDQALYRFRGATVENFVDFPQRCEKQLGLTPRPIPLVTNYRSRKGIVDFYSKFIMKCDWNRPAPAEGAYRVTEKEIAAARTDSQVSVVASTPAEPVVVCKEIAQFVKRLIDEKKVEDPNQIAFLFPAFKYRGEMNEQVKRMMDALTNEGLLVYAPRAGRFLEVEEPTAIFGVFLQVFGRPTRGLFSGREFNAFHAWLDQAHDIAKQLLRADPQLAQFVADRQAEIAAATNDYQRLLQVVTSRKWDVQAPYDLAKMKRPLYDAPGLSERAKKALGSYYFEQIVQHRSREGKPFTLDYIIKRATSLDWNVLDLFYRLCGFEHFKRMLDLAEAGTDEGPICNLGLISQHLARFMDEYRSVLTADVFLEGGFLRMFFSTFLYTLFRRGETEYEDAEDPFPKGRIPFLTVHQAKGLEFPIVVLGNARKDDRGPQPIEEIVRPFIQRESEPLDRLAEFDIMRMFYVALSRAKNLLVVAHFSGRGNRVNPPFKELLDAKFPRIPKFDTTTVPTAKLEQNDLPKNYSYTGDYLLYQRCPRQYMIFRKYGFAPSRSQTMLFGSLVHRTLDDLHQYLISRRSQP